MPRNAGVVRRWQVLRHIEASRLGASTHEVAALTGVTRRTIRRDLEALPDAVHRTPRARQHKHAHTA